MNKVILVGNVGADPKTFDFSNGGKMASFPLATSRRYKDKEGNILEQTAWHRIQFTADKVDTVARLVKKGSLVHVDGAIRYDTFTDKEGNEVSRTVIHGTAFNILAFPKRKDGEEEAAPEDEEAGGN
ncbi:hypothetical protein H4R18_000703 [Coemansia javaensis]|uniref:Single-stranded DNA-binding protein n=1 Tax=Coemansia javaensis TaxID=2761396 RepID=A0A9W8LMM6_9FUNG|nr:hypothetical protein H4R18_000703 [Coemansia javaensis]